MPTLFSESIIHLVVYFAILAVLISIAVYVLLSLRAGPLKQEPQTEEQLDYFRELNSQGKLSDAEFRIIKRQLSSQIVFEEKEKQREEPWRTDRIDPAILLAKGRQNGAAGTVPPDFSEDQEETKIFGHDEDNSSDDTVVGR